MDFETLGKETRLCLDDIRDPEQVVFTKESISDGINEFLGNYNEDFNNVEQNSELIDDLCKDLCTVKEIETSNVSLESSDKVIEMLSVLGDDRAWYFHMLNDHCPAKLEVVKELSEAISKVLNNHHAYEKGEHVEISREEVISIWKNN